MPDSTTNSTMWAVTAKDGPAPVELPVPERERHDDVLIRILRSGICSTDREVMNGYSSFDGILGHEFVGEVVEADLYGWMRRRVTAHINIPAEVKGVVDWRRAKHDPGRQAIGIRGRNGTHTEYIVLPEGVLVPVPDAVSDAEAAMAEPLAAAMDAVSRLPMGSDPVLLVGDGRLAQLAARIMRAYDREVHAVGRHDRKLEMLRNIGVVTLAHDPEPASYRGVIEMSGSAEGARLGLQAVTPEGILVLKSTHQQDLELDLSHIVVNEIKVIGSRCGDVDRAVMLLSEDAFVVEDLVDGVYPLRDSVAAFEQAFNGHGLKIQFDPRK